MIFSMNMHELPSLSLVPALLLQVWLIGFLQFNWKIHEAHLRA